MLGRYKADGVDAGPGLTVMAVTPDGSSLISTTAWAETVDAVDTGEALGALHDATEADQAPMVIAALSAVLGCKGRANVATEAAAIRKTGRQPLLVVLAAPDGTSSAHWRPPLRCRARLSRAARCIRYRGAAAYIDRHDANLA